MHTKKRAELRDIHKIFETPGNGPDAAQSLIALDGVSLVFLPGEIHAILGENGAGKSTLVNILSGLNQPSRGCILVGGKELCFDSPAEALSAGIAMVHQRPLLSGEISVLENIILGATGIFLRRTSCRKTIGEIARRWNIALDLNAPARTLDAAGRLYTALLGALYRKPDFLILDEPAAVLFPDERERFFRAMQTARAAGLGIILITHKLDEAARWSDRVSVLRRGRLIYSSSVRDPVDSIPVTESLLAGLLNPAPAKPDEKGRTYRTEIKSSPPPASLALAKVTAAPPERNPVFAVSFTAMPGRITGIFGLPGSGLDTLEDILSGMITAESGTISSGGSELDIFTVNPAVLRERGIAIVPSDRAFRGSHPELTIFDILTVYRPAAFLRLRARDKAFVAGLLADAHIDALPERTVKTLSGGQLQRLILARELSTGPGILILAEPEWGLDIHSAALLRQRLRTSADGGMTVIILTDDLDSIGDRAFYNDTLTLKEGRLS